MQIITRKQAKVRGLRWYFTGRPCPCGHIAERIVANADCQICDQIRKVAFRKKRRYANKNRKLTGDSIWYFTGKPCKRGHIAERYVANGSCRICTREQERKWRKANSDRVRSLASAWREKNRERARQLDREWRRKNIVRFNELSRLAGARYRKKHPKSHLKWQRNNPDKIRANKGRRRARKLNAAGKYTTNDIMQLFDKQKALCAYHIYCGNTLEKGYDVDHIVPLVKGGTNWPSNLQLCCDSCNSRKADLDHDVFVARLEKAKGTLTDGAIRFRRTARSRRPFRSTDVTSGDQRRGSGL